MPQEHLEIIRRFTEAMNVGDVEAALAVIDPEVEFVPRRAPVQGSYRGHEGIRGFFADTAESFDVFQATHEEIHDLGDAVVVVSTLLVRGKGSGAEVTDHIATVLRLRDGKIIYFKTFPERSTALEAAGLQQ